MHLKKARSLLCGRIHWYLVLSKFLSAYGLPYLFTGSAPSSSIDSLGTTARATRVCVLQLILFVIQITFEKSPFFGEPLLFPSRTKTGRRRGDLQCRTRHKFSANIGNCLRGIGLVIRDQLPPLSHLQQYQAKNQAPENRITVDQEFWVVGVLVPTSSPRLPSPSPGPRLTQFLQVYQCPGHYPLKQAPWVTIIRSPITT